jgi:hypothetical protein
VLLEQSKDLLGFYYVFLTHVDSINALALVPSEQQCVVVTVVELVVVLAVIIHS